MATDSPFNGGVSSLLKSATSTAATIANFQDQEQAFDWTNSAYTDDAYNAYSDYLTGRINSLQATGSIADASKALTLMGTLRSATHDNVSAGIQRENIQVLAGNATPQDKLNLINDQFQRANENGDLTLAQSLMSQSYSLSQTIQYDAQQSAAAAKTLADANAAAQGDVVTNLNSSVKQLNEDIKTAGNSNFNSTVSKWVDGNKDALAALGVKLTPGEQPNYFNIVEGIAGAQYTAYMLAYTAEKDTNPEAALKNYNAAIAINEGITKLPTSGFVGKDLSLQEVQQAMQDPSRYAYDQATGTLKQTKQSGNIVDANGVVTPTFTGKITQNIYLTPAQTTEMNQLGLQFSENKNGTTGNGVQVQTTQNTPQYIKNVTGPNGVINVFNSPNGNAANGNLQFAAESKNGPGQDVYTIVTDGTGKKGLLGASSKTDPLGNHPQEFLGTDPGFDAQSAITGQNNNDGSNHPGFFGKVVGEGLNGIENAAGNTLSGGLNLFGGNASAQQVIGGAQTQFQIAQQNAAAARALIAQPAPALPNISFAAPPPTAPITIAPPSAPQTKSIVPTTVNPQKPTVNPQSPGGINLQGGGGIRLQ